MKKTVRITIEMDTEFIKVLNLNIGLSAKKDPVGILASAVLREARGGLVKEVQQAVPDEWKAHLSIIHDERNVREVEDDYEVMMLDGKRRVLREAKVRQWLEEAIMDKNERECARALVKEKRLRRKKTKHPLSGTFVYGYEPV